MKSSILALVVAYVATTAVDGHLDSRGLKRRADQLYQDCQKAMPSGLICNSCTEVGRCLCSGTTCKTMTYTNCSAGQICRDGMCIVGTMCTPEKQPEFPCSSPGMFPDPYDCKAYYICAPCEGTALKAIRVLCGEDPATGKRYGYNPSTNICSTALTNGECPSLPIPVCKNAFEIGIVPNSNSYLHYICLNTIENGQMTSTLYPYQDACHFGRRYSTSTKTCVY